MCLGVPLRILSIEGKEGVGELNGIKRKVRVDLIEELNINDFVMVHAGFAIEKIDEAAALETLSIFDELERTVSNE